MWAVEFNICRNALLMILTRDGKQLMISMWHISVNLYFWSKQEVRRIRSQVTLIVKAALRKQQPVKTILLLAVLSRSWVLGMWRVRHGMNILAWFSNQCHWYIYVTPILQGVHTLSYISLSFQQLRYVVRLKDHYLKPLPLARQDGSSKTNSHYNFQLHPIM